MTSTHRLIRLWPLAVLACLSLATVSVVASGAVAKSSSTKKSAKKKSTKRATRSCPEMDYPGGKGNGYVHELRATRISCGYAKKFVFRFYRCRTRSSKSGRTNKEGRCTRRLSRFKCSERRGLSSAVEFNSTATCRRGKSRIIISYQQNL